MNPVSISLLTGFIFVTLPRRLMWDKDADGQDRETLAAVIKNGLRKLEDKNGSIRLRNDGTVVLSRPNNTPS